MRPLASGLIGATALTAIHETGRRLIPDPPRMDVVGARAVVELCRLSGCEAPTGRRLYGVTMAGDVISNGIYYAAITGRTRAAIWTKAVVLGLAAGIGAVRLPEPLGLGEPPNNRRGRTRLLTITWYLAGALVAAAAATPRRTTAGLKAAA
jgi:hypothetical protein